MSKLCESIFGLDNLVSYVAVLDGSNTVLECGFRDADANIPSDIMRKFVALSPLLILGSMDRLREVYGDVRYVTARFNDRMIVLYEIKSHIVFLVLDKYDTARVERIRETIMNWL